VRESPKKAEEPPQQYHHCDYHAGQLEDSNFVSGLGHAAQSASAAF